MSRSYRKTPFLQVTGGGSNKQDKRFANRKLRRIVKQALSGWTEYTVLPTLREVSNVWDFSCEAWQYFSPTEHSEWLRK
jgi:hypothetical protein